MDYSLIGPVLFALLFGHLDQFLSAPVPQDFAEDVSPVELFRCPSNEANGRGTLAVEKDSYVVIIDAGSSHTDIFVYKWTSQKVNGSGLVTEEGKLICKRMFCTSMNSEKHTGMYVYVLFLVQPC